MRPHLLWAQPVSYSVGTGRRLQHESDHLPPFSAEDAWGITTTPPYAIMAWYLIMHTDNLTLYNIAINWLAFLSARDFRI